MFIISNSLKIDKVTVNDWCQSLDDNKGVCRECFAVFIFKIKINIFKKKFKKAYRDVKKMIKEDMVVVL